jgi:hypothetical protein
MTMLQRKYFGFIYLQAIFGERRCSGTQATRVLSKSCCRDFSDSTTRLFDPAGQGALISARTPSRVLQSSVQNGSLQAV